MHSTLNFTGKTDIALIAKKYHGKTLAIALEIGDRNLEGSCYENLGLLVTMSTQKNILRKRLRSQPEIGDRNREGSRYGNLGTVFLYLGDYVKANLYYQKAIVIALKLKNNSKSILYALFHSNKNIF